MITMRRSPPKQDLSGRRLATVALFLLLLPLPAMASGLDAVVENFLREQASARHDEVQITVYPPGARFPVCPEPVPFLPGRAGQLLGRVSVGIRCADAHDSIRYINAEIRAVGTWPTAAVRIPTGSEITAEMLTTARGNLSGLSATTLREADEIVGRIARRTLIPGQPVRQHDVHTRPVVDRGQEVTVESGGTGFVVRRQGKALETGAMGETIRVQLDRRNTLHATITDKGTVRVQ